MYIFTLDSHDCYGKFDTLIQAHEFAVKRGLRSYQLLPKPPFLNTLVRPPILKGN